MKKKRIFIANDASFLDTGYGIYGKEILTRLHNSDKYEVAELACFCDKTNPGLASIPWKIYPNTVPLGDDRTKIYKSNIANQYGLWRFNRCLADFRPHIVFDIRDYWMFAYQEVSPFRKYFNWVIMPATDSAPPRQEWLFTFANADVVIPYTDWAKKTLSESCGSKINLFPKIANAGINPEEFYPVADKIQHKIKYFGKDLNIIGLVMRNQKRKLLADIMLVFKKYLELLKNHNNIDLYHNTYLYLHTTYPEENGWDIPNLLLEMNLLDKVYFTYCCKNCKRFYPSKFQNALTLCKHCDQISAGFAGAGNPINTAGLNDIYNTFDLFIQYAICEGFGMPQVEAAACGVPIASVDYSAMTEITEKLGGFKIPIDRKFRELETNAYRCYPDNDATVNIIYDFFVNMSSDYKKQLSEETRKKCIDYYTWDKVYSVWEECFDSININSKVPWDTIKISETNQNNLKVPKGLNKKEFIEYIITNVINEPYLINTAPIQMLIKDFINGLVARNSVTKIMKHEEVIDILESHLNNKIMCEQMRSNFDAIKKEDFI